MPNQKLKSGLQSEGISKAKPSPKRAISKADRKKVFAKATPRLQEATGKGRLPEEYKSRSIKKKQSDSLFPLRWRSSSAS